MAIFLGKKCLLPLCMLIFLIAGCTRISQGEENKSKETSPISNESTQRTRHIFTLGDSLTAGYRLPKEEGYPAQLQKILQSRGHVVRVINGGHSGDTSKQLYERIERSLGQAQSGDIAIIVIGGNDGLQGLPTDQMKNTINKIIQFTKNRGLTVVVGGMQILPNMGVEYAKDFRIVYEQIAKETNSKYIPFFLSGVAGDPAYNLADGIHPNASGYTIIAENVADFLIKENIVQ